MSRSTSTRAAADRRLERRALLRAGVTALGAALLPGLVARAQDARPGDEPTADGRVATTDLGGGLSLLTASGVNVLALRGNGGTLLVDGGPAETADALLRAVQAATGNDRVHTLILTHGHPEQIGANERVGRAGGKILAHAKTQLYLSHPGYSALFDGRREPLPEIARPSVTVRDEGSLAAEGFAAEYGYLPAAHTDGDLFVRFPERNVLAAGGVVSAERWPLLDWRNGAWFGGRVRALQRLASLVKPDTRVVPAEGRLLTGRDVVRHREIYDALFETMIGYMNKGYGAEDVVRENPLKGHEAELGPAAAFLDGAYRSMLIAYVPD